MPSFGVAAGRDGTTDLNDFAPGAPEAPQPFWSAVGAGYDSAAQVHNLGAREEGWRTALWERDRDVMRRTGQALAPSLTMLGQNAPSGGVGYDPAETAWLSGQKFQGDGEHEAAIDALRQKFPAQMQGVPSLAELRAQTDQHMRQIEARAGQAAQGHPVGQFLGAAAGGLTDPVQEALLPFGGLGAGEEIGAAGLRSVATATLRRMATQAALQGGSQAIEAPFRAAEAQAYGGPAYTPSEAVGDVIGGVVGGAGFEALMSPLHAGFHLLWGMDAARGAADALDTSLRDAAAVNPGRDGGDFTAGVSSLETGAPRPDVETRKNLDELFANRPASPVQLPELGEAGQGDLPASAQAAGIYARADYRGRPIYASSLDPRQLGAAPELFQYKAGGDAEGVTARLQGVKAWDPVSSGKAMFWEDPNGRLFVADGHQRRGLALRLEQQGFEPKLDGYLFRAADGWGAGEVRTLAALKNIREGQGSPLDAAKVFKAAPGALNDDSLPVSGDFIAQAKGLARLSDEAFGAAVNGVIPERQAAAIGELAGDRPDLHADMVRLMKQAEPANLDEARALIQEAKLDDWLKHEPGQADLFGAAPRDSIVIARAKVNAAVLGALRRDARAFAGVVKNADALEAGGNALARDANEASLAVNSAAIEAIQKLSLRHGEIGEAMSAAAARVLEGEKAADAARGIVTRIKSAIAAGENLAELRAEAIDPPPPPEAQLQALDAFAEPGGEGQKAQIPPKPEDARLEAPPAAEAAAGEAALPPGLFDDLEPIGAHQQALDRLKPCAPGE